MEYLTLDSVPINEEAIQLGSDQDYLGKEETRIYYNQLNRHFKEQLENSRCFLKVNPNHYHNGGTYYDVIVKYPENSEKDDDIAVYMQDNLPMEWDEESIVQLKEKGIRDLTKREKLVFTPELVARINAIIEEKD